MAASPISIKIDDTILEKPHSTENEIICWHWDHSKKPQAGGSKRDKHPQLFVLPPPLGTTDSISVPAAFEIVKKTEPYFEKKAAR
jgi:hypothetical protein